METVQGASVMAIIVADVCERCGKIFNRDTRMTLVFDTGAWWRMCKPCSNSFYAEKADDAEYISEMLRSLSEAKRA